MPFESDKVITAMQARIPIDGEKFCKTINAVYHIVIEEKKGGPTKTVTFPIVGSWWVPWKSF